jgi:uncharacterized protein (TIGR02302 family)
MMLFRSQAQTPQAAFERKVRRSRLALFVEELWPRVWLVLAVIGLFVVVSLFGLWAQLGSQAHQAVLGAFAVALIAAIVTVARVRWPSREEAVRRIERRSGIAHRPASAYEDTLTLNASDPTTQAIWQAHKARLAALVQRMRSGPPQPRTDRYDPLAVRALLTLALVALLALVGDGARDRLMAAFRLGPPILAADARVDAWVTPPAYTSRPPVLLADGANPQLGLAGRDGKPIEVPENSVLIARSSGLNAKQLELEVRPDGQSSERVAAMAATPGGEVSEVRATLKRSGTIRVLGGGSELFRWAFNVIPDKPPTISLVKDPEVSRRGSIKLTYKVEDDYGVSSAEARFEAAGDDVNDPGTAWAREESAVSGPRPPRERPPVLTLRLPRPNAKDPTASSFHELANHPLAGMPARLTLIARDHAGNVGRSATIEIKIPERQFTRQLARAVVEQRRKLAIDPRMRGQILEALDALTIEPETYLPDRSVYLGLRSAYHRLARDKSRETLKSVSDQLWSIALRIEDGRNLSDAERRLRDLQDQLSKAIQDGASDEELQRLMQELRQALAEYLQQLAEQGQRMDMPEGMDPSQMLSQQDLDRMLQNLENMMRQGSRDMAQEMLNQLRDLIDRLQSGRMARGQSGQGQQMMQMLDQMGDLIGRQQQLMDDTFGERQGQRGQQGQDRQGQGRDGQGDLSQRQGQLRDRLDQLQQNLRKFGQQGPPQFGEAGEAMSNAERALRQGDLDTATREQGRALEQLRQGAQQMAEEMLRQMPNRFGQGPTNGDVPRDPLGRPQRSEGPDLGTTVRVPDEIDVQRAREILEELRRRLGDQWRPSFELEYLERLLKRF